jgi:hypothetical protein
MGRHSAPDDDAELSTDDAVVVTRATRPGAGRHYSAEADDDAESVEPTVPLPSVKKPAKDARSESGTHHDLRLLRENPALRARCAAAVIVPFLLFTAALVVVGRVDIYLLWVWIPTVTAGVLVGTFLDAEHRRGR